MTRKTMSKQNKTILIAVIGTTLVITGLSGMWSFHRWNMYIEGWKEVVPITFYGRVVDDRESSVSDAEVTINITTVDWSYILGAPSVSVKKEITLNTDKDGRFHVEGKRGSAVMVTDIAKAGFSYDWPHTRAGTRGRTAFYYGGPGVPRSGPHQPDPNKPVTFKMIAETQP